MTSQLAPSRSTETSASNRIVSATISDDAQLMKLMKSYQADQQVKYLHLQAEIEVLLQQLQSLKQNNLQQSDRNQKN